MATLSGKTLLFTGASRGIGLAIALRAARDGANAAVADRIKPCATGLSTARLATARLELSGRAARAV